ncbi:Mitochondrial genome maintenance exonuclease 1 [Gryllus bimaculatus]|nr:Mitochondrial genome maintenance exonuclease 1 [Gryllus bimaculatus]
MNLMNKCTHWGCILRSSVYRKYSVKSAKKLLQKDSSKSSKKGENAKLLKRYNKENKLLFGSLVETLPQKRKKEINGPINENLNYMSDANDKSSEAWWWKSRLKANVKPNHTLLPSQENRCDEANTSGNMKDITEYGSVLRSNVCEPTPVMSERIVNNIVRSSVFHKSNLRLPNIIVKNLAVFPLENKRKQTLRLSSSSSPILHVSPTEDNDLVRTKSKEYPSVSRILNATLSDSSRAALQKWKENLIAELGEEGFQKYQRALLEHGQMFHKTVQEFLSGESIDDIQIDSAVEGCWLSIQTTLKEIGAVKVLERHVVHEELLGKLLLIEWKKSNKQKSTLWNTYDAPLQVAAYVGALNFDTNYDIKVDGGLVVVAYSDGSPAHVHPLNKSQCEKYWQMWLNRLRLYWDLFDKQEASNVPNALSL